MSMSLFATIKREEDFMIDKILNPRRKVKDSMKDFDALVELVRLEESVKEE